MPDIKFRYTPGWEAETARELRASGVMDRLGGEMRTHSRRMAPVRTGALRNSIDYTISDEGEFPVLYLYAGVDYAAYVELGTRYMGAQPYLRPAIERRWDV